MKVINLTTEKIYDLACYSYRYMCMLPWVTTVLMLVWFVMHGDLFSRPNRGTHESEDTVTQLVRLLHSRCCIPDHSMYLLPFCVLLQCPRLSKGMT